ncbi:MAG: transposase [Patescibacteria group bacterium]
MKRYNIPGQVHFVTTRTLNSVPYFSDNICCDILLSVINRLRNELKFNLIGFVLNPNHIHLLLKLWVGSNLFEPEANEFASTRGNISYVVQRIKGGSAREINRYLKTAGCVWQKNFYDFNIYSERKLIQKLNYIHYNPVKHGLVKNPEDWRYSSWQNYYQDDDSTIIIDRID